MSNKGFDIRSPKKKVPTPRVVEVSKQIPYIPIEKPEEPKKKQFKIPVIASLLIFLSVIGIFGFNLLQFKHMATNSAPGIYQNFKDGASALFNFDLSEAKEYFQSASAALEELNDQAPLKTAPSILEDLFQISQNAALLSSDLEEIKTEGAALLVSNKGAFLIEMFKNIQRHLYEIDFLSGNLKTQASELGYDLGSEFDQLGSKLGDSNDFLTAFLGWLEAPKKQHLLIFFQNPSEIRPAGGFIGSYGHLSLFQGNLLSAETIDVYDPDGQLDLDVIPPKPLQGITNRWGARDANWFFDFPTSAKKVIQFLETSKIHQEYGIKFSGAIAINVGVIEDILELIGSVDLPDYDLVITHENFLREVQKEVEAGDDKALLGDPKRILKTLTPVLFDRLASLKESEKELLVERLTGRLERKDIMIYFKDPIIENYFIDQGVAGEVLSLANNFSGEYLAVVNANIGGGKSDAFIEQDIQLISKIGASGPTANKLMVIRKHKGQNEDEWWYNKMNRNYLQVFVTPGAQLEDVSGNTKRSIDPLIDYSETNYITDKDLSEFENGELAHGKTVFRNWFDIKPGEVGALEIYYSTPQQRSQVEGPFQFIFEKQSGVNGSLRVILEAPEGYQWQENQSGIFEYASDDLTARTVLDLELVPLEAGRL